MLGILGVVCLYGMIAYAGLRTARRAAGRYAKLLATGLTSLILCQGILNIFVVLGLAPLTGVPLPFISYAPTNLCVHARRRRSAAEHRPPGRAAAGRRGHRKLTAPRIVIGAGGTAGHVVPALAVADALRADGAEVTFVGGDRAELELVPAAGYELRTLRVMPLPRGRPLKAARAALVAAARRPARRGGSAQGAAPRRGPRRRRLRGRTRRAAGGALAGSAGADRGRQPSRADQPPAGAVRAAGVPGVPDRGPRRPRATCSPGGRCRRRRPTARRRAARFGIGLREIVRARVRRLPGRPLDQPRGDRGVRRSALPRPARRRRARPARSRDLVARAALRPARLHPATSARRCSRATSWWRAPAGRSSRSPPRAGPRC